MDNASFVIIILVLLVIIALITSVSKWPDDLDPPSGWI